MSKHQYYQRKPQNIHDIVLIKKERAMKIFAYDEDITNTALSKRLHVSLCIVVKWREEFNNVQSK